MQYNIIQLNDIKLWGFHGCLSDERKIGSYFTINLTLFYDTSKAESSDSLNDTIDYSAIYNLVEKEFKQPSNLLENVCRRILNSIHTEFSEILNSVIKINKLNPPMKGEIHSASVTLSYNDVFPEKINFIL